MGGSLSYHWRNACWFLHVLVVWQFSREKQAFFDNKPILPGSFRTRNQRKTSRKAGFSLEVSPNWMKRQRSGGSNLIRPLAPPGTDEGSGRIRQRSKFAAELAKRNNFRAPQRVVTPPNKIRSPMRADFRLYYSLFIFHHSLFIKRERIFKWIMHIEATSLMNNCCCAA